MFQAAKSVREAEEKAKQEKQKTALLDEEAEKEETAPTEKADRFRKQNEMK